MKSDLETRVAVLAISGLILSVLIIIWALVILVRFWIFDSIYYNIFLLCMLSAGIIGNIASLNLILTDVVELHFILPFIYGYPVTLFWTVLCIFMPIAKQTFFSQFAFMPIALYDANYYDGLGFNPNNTDVHPFAKPFIPENSFFENTLLILIILIVAASKLNLVFATLTNDKTWIKNVS